MSDQDCWPTDTPEHLQEVLERTALEAARSSHRQRISSELGGESDFQCRRYRHEAGAARGALTRAANRAEMQFSQDQIKKIIATQEEGGRRKAWMDIAKANEARENHQR